jgi:hypothetical protein
LQTAHNNNNNSAYHQDGRFVFSAQVKDDGGNDTNDFKDVLTEAGEEALKVDRQNRPHKLEGCVNKLEGFISMTAPSSPRFSFFSKPPSIDLFTQKVHQFDRFKKNGVFDRGETWKYLNKWLTSDEIDSLAVAKTDLDVNNNTGLRRIMGEPPVVPETPNSSPHANANVENDSSFENMEKVAVSLERMAIPVLQSMDQNLNQTLDQFLKNNPTIQIADLSDEIREKKITEIIKDGGGGNPQPGSQPNNEAWAVVRDSKMLPKYNEYDILLCAVQSLDVFIESTRNCPAEAREGFLSMLYENMTSLATMLGCENEVTTILKNLPPSIKNPSRKTQLSNTK